MCGPVKVNLVYSENYSSSKGPVTKAAVNKTSGRIRKPLVSKSNAFFVVKQSQRQFYSPGASNVERLSNFQRFMATFHFHSFLFIIQMIHYCGYRTCHYSRNRKQSTQV